ncbi:MAG: Arginine N-succinyltransferase [Acidimicrobiales bacterium]|nr:Arginine N-succinyltransferase [Acidimicrobiales bacterium]
MYVRPVEVHDLDDLIGLFGAAGRWLVGMSNLTAAPDVIEERIALSQRSFQSEVAQPGEEFYWFVLVEEESGEVVGTSGIAAAVGLRDPFYSYKVGTLVHASPKLDVYSRHRTLYLTNDYTGLAELCSLYLSPGFRRHGVGRLLSLHRLLFIAENMERFPPRAIAEMRGVIDESGVAPFWQGLGARFFAMSFVEADRAYGEGNKSFIAELMPRHPIYVDLLPPAAQAAIGEVHERTLPALRMLEEEGFSDQGYVDIFDAGATIEASLAQVRAVRESAVATAVAVATADACDPLLVANRELGGYRCVMSDRADLAQLAEGAVIGLPAAVLERLGVQDGGEVRLVKARQTPPGPE